MEWIPAWNARVLHTVYVLIWNKTDQNSSIRSSAAEPCTNAVACYSWFEESKFGCISQVARFDQSGIKQEGKKKRNKVH